MCLQLSNTLQKPKKNGGECGETIQIFSSYQAASENYYHETLAKERKEGLLSAWGDKAVIVEQRDDYIVYSPCVDQYVSRHYKLYVQQLTLCVDNIDDLFVDVQTYKMAHAST